MGLILSLGLGGCGQVSSVAHNSSQGTDPSLPSNNTNSSSTGLEESGIEEQPVRIGVLTIDSALSVHNRYAPLLEHLSKVIGQPFELVPLTQESQFTAVEQGEIDFITNNPLAAVQVQRLYNTEFLVTYSRPRSGTQFSALIIVKADSTIQTLEDLKGKQVACVNFETAAAGCLFQVYHLLQNNIDPFQDFDPFIENSSQDNIVLAVLNGTLDAGFIRTGQLEKMLKNDLLSDLDDLRILDPINDTFVFKHTTALYPEWPIAALPGTDPELRDALQSALVTLPEGHTALSAANIEQFTEAVDYQPIHDLIETLQLKSWDVD
ncbi:MAG: phosphate/phosphite/phosphonate ABC transporter substrate-binding protein [Symploca sp. SIO2B6]|nr:phosphate/phosphite/phosphonate ABC transporter substrate-binding protein [Symploca sp. SIO2B6]